MTDQAMTANTASGSIWAVKSHTNNMTIEGLAEEGLLAKAEFKMDETKASLGIFLQQPLVKAEDLSAPVHFTTTGFTDFYPWLMPELATVNTDKSIKAWRLDFGSLGSDSKYWYEGTITVKGEETTISWLANNVDDRPVLSTSTTYRVAGLMVDAFSIGSTEIGSNSTSKIGNYTLLRNVSGDAKTVAAASTASAAYFKVYQGDMILTKSAIVPPTPVVPKNTDEVMTMIAKKDISQYEKYPFWTFKNNWYQSTVASNYMKLQTATSGGNFNKFVATNILCKGEIPNGSVVISMGGDYGYRPEGWVNDKTKTATRPDRTDVQVTEVDDAWWTSGSQTFGYRAFNLDKGVNNLTDAEMDEVIEKFAVYVPKPTKAKPDPDAVFTTAGYKLEDYKKLELTYNKYAFYNSTGDNGGVLQTKENVPTATNLGQFVATGIIDKANIPNGSVLVVCDGYQYRPEGWQVKGEKNTADRPGNVTTATVVVDDAWWGNFNHRAFNLAYAGNPGIPVTEMDHVIASFAIYVPKVLTVERVWGKYPGEWPQLVGYNANEDRCVAMDEDYVYVAKAAEGTAGIKAISITDPTIIKDVDVTGIEGGHFPTSCVRTVYSTTKRKHILLASSMAMSEGQTLKIYAWENGISEAPKVLLNWTLGQYRRFGDFFTVFGTYEDAEIYFRNNTQTTDAKCNLTAQFVLKDGALTAQWPNAFFNGYGGSKGMGSIYLYQKGGTKWYLVTDAIGMFFPAGEQAGEEWGNGDDYSVWAKLFGVEPFEFNGKKYIAYHKMINLARGWLTITKDVNGTDAKFKDSLIQGKLDENIIFQGAVQINSDTPSTEVVSGATHSANTMGNCDVIVKDDAAYIVSHQQNTGIAVFKMYMK